MVGEPRYGEWYHNRNEDGVMERQAIENRLLGNILAVTSTMTIGKTKAARIVGGERKLQRLHLSGAIECTGKVNAQNGKWRYNLAQVLQHCRPAK